MAVFYNQATLTYNGTTTNSNIVTGEIVEVLSATKTAVSDEYSAGDRITYVVSLINSGATVLSGLTLTDDLGSYEYGTFSLTPLTYVSGSVLYYINGVLQPAPAVSAQNPLTISGISVPAGGNALIIYDATVNQYAPLDIQSTITNTVTVTGGGLVSDTVATETVTADSAANLTISKALTPSSVAENGQITYTFVIENSGNTQALATDSVVVTDTFDPILSNLAVSFNGTPWTQGTEYTYDQTTGVFTTTAGQITVDAATYTQDQTTGQITATPGVSVLTVTGTV